MFRPHSIVVRHHPSGVAYYTPRQRLPLLRLALRALRHAPHCGEDCPTPAELGLRWRGPEEAIQIALLGRAEHLRAGRAGVIPT